MAAGGVHLPNLSELLECSVCLDLCSGRIQQCKNGHNICASHTPHLSHCPVCRIAYREGSSRNILAETLVAVERDRIQALQNSRQGRAVPSAPAATMATPPSRYFPPTPSAPPPPPQSSTGSNRYRSPPPAPRNSTVLCAYNDEGCPYQNGTNSVLRHQQDCHFRPIYCCLKTDGCNNAQIPFGEYIPHLINTHGVKNFTGPEHLQTFVVKADRKMARNGSTSLFILEVDNQDFLIRAKERDDMVYMWIAYHGRPQDGKKYKGKIEFDFPNRDGSDDDNSDNNEEDYDDDGDDNDYETDESSDYQDAEESDEDGSDDGNGDYSFSGRVRATTRMSLDEIEETGNYFAMSVGDVENNLAAEKVGRRTTIDTWAINVKIHRN